MKPQIVLRKIATAATHFIELRYSSGVNRDACSDRGAIALRPDQVEEHPVIWSFIDIQEQRRWFADIEHNDIYIAVIGDVTESSAPPDRG